MDEFTLINRFFASQSVARDDVLLGIGDDAALVRPPPGMVMAVTTDMLVAGVHFTADTDPRAVGHKALAVNLSDLAAVGAEPAWAVLSLALPAAEENWLAGFRRGLLELAQRYGVQLVGGDTVRGPLAVAVTLHGWVPPQAARRRAGACAGDGIYVTGTLGDAALGLKRVLGTLDLGDDGAALVARLAYPQPRISAGLQLRDVANAMIDISDGLVADLGHILTASGVGAQVEVESVPRSDAFRRQAQTATLGDLALTGGDDYELCFTVPPQRETALKKLGLDCPVTRIGTIEAAPGLRIVNSRGRPYVPTGEGFDHFAGRD